MEGLKKRIFSETEPMYTKELEDKAMGCFVTVQDIINHLHQHGSTVLTYNKEATLVEHDHLWDPSMHVVTYFNHVKKSCQRTSQSQHQTKALTAFKI